MAGEKNLDAFSSMENDLAAAAGVRRAEGHSWTNLAFVVEALILLFAIIVSMTVFTSLYAKAGTLATRSEDLTAAIKMAQSAAEEFSNDPASVAAGTPVGLGFAAGQKDTAALSVTCDVTSSKTDAGTLYQAHITVNDSDVAAGSSDGAAASEIFSLDASRYVSEAN